MSQNTNAGHAVPQADSLREKAIRTVRRRAKDVSVAIGERTAKRRALPDFIMVGGQRCGTTSLFKALSEHPGVIRPNLHKGVNYFDLSYYRGRDWYAGHFPLRSTVRRRGDGGATPLVFEASGYYLFHPFAIERMANDLPSVKIIAMLRDPVERAYSAWKHESARGFETEDFRTALTLESDRLAGETERMRNDPRYESLHHRHHAYRSRGDYLEQLERAASVLPREQIHVLYSEDLFADPGSEFSRVEEFLGLGHEPDINFGQHNARPSQSLSTDLRVELRKHYEHERDNLEAFVGRPAPWPRDGDKTDES